MEHWLFEAIRLKIPSSPLREIMLAMMVHVDSLANDLAVVTNHHEELVSKFEEQNTKAKPSETTFDLSAYNHVHLWIRQVGRPAICAWCPDQEATKTSSAPIPGSASKLSESSMETGAAKTVSLEETLAPLIPAITAYFKLTPFTAPEWAAYLKVSSILQSMFELHTPSGSTRDGGLGPVDPE